MPSLHGFLLRILIWLPICFAGWYFASILFTMPLRGLVDLALTGSFPAVFSAVAQDGNALVIVTNLSADADGRAGELVFSINPLKYGYCVPLFTALVLATPGVEDSRTALNWLLGMLILTATQVFGISAEALKIVAFQLNAEAREVLGFSAWGYESLALAYQFGYLILPPVAPILIWLWLYRATLVTITGWAPHVEDSR